jgi:hypothetical protein
MEGITVKAGCREAEVNVFLPAIYPLYDLLSVFSRKLMQLLGSLLSLQNTNLFVC